MLLECPSALLFSVAMNFGSDLVLTNLDGYEIPPAVVFSIGYPIVLKWLKWL
jgi:hypothetical protein